MHYCLIRLTLKSRHELMTMLATTLCRRYAKQRDCVWIEIPIERADKTIHSEVLIAEKRELK